MIICLEEEFPWMIWDQWNLRLHFFLNKDWPYVYYDRIIARCWSPKMNKNQPFSQNDLVWERRLIGNCLISLWYAKCYSSFIEKFCENIEERIFFFHLNSILKSRDITLLTKVCKVKAMVFPVVVYGCESWTIKKAECQRTDTFKLWCWRRLLRVPWTARISN